MDRIKKKINSREYNIDIIYEDNHLLVAYKPQGVLSQKDITNDDSMVEIVKEYLKKKYDKPGNVYLGLVHRLDRMTEGIMVFAKTSKAAARLSSEIAGHSTNFTKKYMAIVYGKFVDKDEHILKDYMITDSKTGVSSIVSSNTEKDVKEAVLYYHVIDETLDTSLLEITLVSGRHHQIRVQLANIGHPLVGDLVYGKVQKKVPLALACFQISLLHPVTKETMSFVHMPNNSLFTTFQLQKKGKESIMY